MVRLESLRALDPQRPRIYFFQDGANYLMREVVITRHISAEEVKKAMEEGIKLAKALMEQRGDNSEE